MKKYIIAGISTEIGKTFVSSIVVEALQADYWKPIQAGNLEDSDTITVRRLVSNRTSVFHPEAYQLKEPMSPHAAAALEGITIALETIQLPQTSNNLVVELAGGLMVPLNDKDLIIDLVKALNLPVILVSKNYLGSINHTLLSIEALKSRQIPIAGIIFNGDSTPSSEQYILQYTGVPCLGRIPTQTSLDASIVTSLAKNLQQTLVGNELV